MADINSGSNGAGVRQRAHHPGDDPARKEPPLDVAHIAFVELLFFAYRDFTGEPDALLHDYAFGRAHHRVLHFVHRNPGLRVADLLDTLKITKQSLARVLKQLIDDGFVLQETGASDRRQRLLFVTERGRALARRLANLQTERIKGALRDAGPDSRAAVARFLLAMVSPEDRAKVLDLVGEPAKGLVDENR